MRAEERELAGLVGGSELLQHQTPEQLGEHQHGEEEAGPGGDPAFAIWGETATGHDHVHVRVVGHGRAPGVQHRGDGDLAPRCLGSAAMVSMVSAEALNKRSQIAALFWQAMSPISEGSVKTMWK